MSGLLRMLRVLAPLAVVCGALFAVSCGGNNSTVAPVSYATSASDVVTLSITPGTVPLPAVSPGNALTLTYIGANATMFPSPVPSAGITMTTTEYSVPQANALQPTSSKRTALARANAVGVYYLTFTVSSSLPAAVFSSETLNIAPTLPANQPYFIELDDLTTQTYINTYPGSTVSNSTVTFTNANGFLTTSNLTNATFASTDTYAMQVYYLTTGSPATATPTPVGTASAAPASPVAVATTLTLATNAQPATNILPVTTGGFVGTFTLPANNPSSAALTVSGQSTLPLTITPANNEYPFFTFGYSASSTVSLASPAMSVFLPTNFSLTSNPIYGSLCTASACPIDAADSAVTDTQTTTSFGTSINFAAGAFPGFTSVGPSPLYVVVYSNRSTPATNFASPVPIAANGTGVITVPSIGASPNTFSSTVRVGGLSGATSVTVGAQTGLFPTVSAVVPNNQTIFYSLQITASPTVSTTSGFQCGTTNCATVSLTIPTATVTAASAALASYYVEECTTAACPVSATDVVSIPLSGNTLTVSPSAFGSDISSFSSNPVFLVFFYR